MILSAIAILIALGALWLVIEAKSTASEQLELGIQAAFRPALAEIERLNKRTEILARTLLETQRALAGVQGVDAAKTANVEPPFAAGPTTIR